MITNKDEYLYYLECDRVSLSRKMKVPFILRDEIWKFQRLLRKREFYQNTNRNKIYALWLRYRYHSMQIKLGFSIPLNVCGPGLSIAHIGNIIISNGAQIGENCRIHAGVNIGANAGATKAATIGNNVYIGPGVKIVGDVYIHDNVTIGANAVVVKNIDESGITVGGVPAKKISDNDSSHHLVKATEFVKNKL